MSSGAGVTSEAQVISGLVLAAGSGSRLGRPKAELVVAGRRLIDRAVTTLLAGGCDQVLAVVRSEQVSAPGARLVVNPEPDEGIGSSLRCGLAALPADSAACVLLLVDLPGVTADEVAAVIAAHAAGARLVAVRRAGRRSHPVLIDRRWYPDFAAAATGDQGGRQLFAAHTGDTVFIDYPDAISDIDTVEDLLRVELTLSEPDPPAPPAPSERSQPAG
ncbi:MAG: nucleotidyltransferase family protein [Jatrophihabitans sp.]